MKKLLYLLSFLSTLSYFSLVIGNLHAKLDQILIFFLFCFLVAGILSATGKIYIDKAGWILILLFFVSMYSSIVNAPDVRYSIIQTINIFSVALVYIIIPNILKTYEDVETFLRIHLRIACVVAIFSFFLFSFSYGTRTEVFGVNLIMNENDPFGVYFTMLEPNIFGSFMVIIFCIIFSVFVSRNVHWRISKKEQLLILFFSAVAILISFTRGVWLGMIVSVLTYYLVNSKNILKTIRQISYLTVFLVFLLYLAGEVWEIGFVKYKITNFFSTAGGTGQGRVLLWTSAIENWIDEGNIFFGTGTYSFASYFNTSGYEARDNAWIGNVYVTFLHDTGIVGLSLYLLFFGYITYATIKSRRYRQLDQYLFIRDMNSGFLMAMISIGIAFFFTTALTFSYPWILFGLISAFNRINKQELRLYTPVLDGSPDSTPRSLSAGL